MAPRAAPPHGPVDTSETKPFPVSIKLQPAISRQRHAYWAPALRPRVSRDKEGSMRHRSSLKWTTLILISIVLVMFSNAQSQTQGELKAFDKDGKPNGECPLKHT